SQLHAVIPASGKTASQPAIRFRMRDPTLGFPTMASLVFTVFASPLGVLPTSRGLPRSIVPGLGLLPFSLPLGLTLAGTQRWARSPSNNLFVPEPHSN